MDFYLCIYILLLFLSRAFIPQLSRDSAATGQPVLIANRDNQTSYLNVLGFFFLCRVRQPMCTLKDFSYFSLIIPPTFFYSKTSEHTWRPFQTSVKGFPALWGGSGYSLCMWPNGPTPYCWEQKPKRGNHSELTIIWLYLLSLMCIYIIYYCEWGRQKFRLFFLNFVQMCFLLQPHN